MVCFFLCYRSATGQTAGPILTSNISKRVFLRQLHSFGNQNNYITILVCPKIPKTAKNRPE